MAMSNAERQRRFRENQKTKIASSSAGMKDTIEKAIAKYNRDCASEPDFVPFTLDDYAYAIAGGRDVDDYGVEAVTGAIEATIFDSLAIADPWPELTREKLCEMIGKASARRAQAHRRGIDIGICGWFDMDKGVPAPPLTLQEKLCAARNRDWLGEAARKQAEKTQAAAERRQERKEAKEQADCEQARQRRAWETAEIARKEVDVARERAEAERIERARIAAENAASRAAAPKVYEGNPNFGRF